MLARIPLLFTIALTGCYYQVEDERAPSPAGKKNDKNADMSEVERCRLSSTTGCFEGQIPSAPNVYVKGKEFFDVEDLANRFHTLIDVKRLTGVKLEANELAINFDAPLDNRNFSNGFQVFLKGENAESARALRSGKFAFHTLPVGAYDLRVQKQLKYRIKVLKKLEGEEAAALIPQEGVIHCATLFSMESVEVLPSVRTKKVFEFYDLMESEFNCTE